MFIYSFTYFVIFFFFVVADMKPADLFIVAVTFEDGLFDGN